MDTITVPLEGWRNAAYPPDQHALTDGGVAVSLVGKTAALDVRVTAGTGDALISLDTTASTSANGIRFTDEAGGVFVIQIDQATMQAAYDAGIAATGGKAGSVLRLVYDLLLISGDGFAEAPIEGEFIINPGVTL